MKAGKPNVTKAVQALGYVVVAKVQDTNNTAAVTVSERYKGRVRVFPVVDHAHDSVMNENSEKDANGYAWHYTPAARQRTRDMAGDIAYRLRAAGFDAELSSFAEAPAAGSVYFVELTTGGLS